jgi:hypothetical protein
MPSVLRLTHAIWWLLVTRYFSRRVLDDGSYTCGGILMDSLIIAAARALAAGDPLRALKRVYLRDDAPALRSFWIHAEAALTS